MCLSLIKLYLVSLTCPTQASLPKRPSQEIDQFVTEKKTTHSAQPRGHQQRSKPMLEIDVATYFEMQLPCAPHPSERGQGSRAQAGQGVHRKKQRKEK